VDRCRGAGVLAFIAEVAGVDGALEVEQGEAVVDLVGAVVPRAQQPGLACLYAIEAGEELLRLSRPPRRPRAEENEIGIGERSRVGLGEQPVELSRAEQGAVAERAAFVRRSPPGIL